MFGPRDSSGRHNSQPIDNKTCLNTHEHGALVISNKCQTVGTANHR